MSQRPSRAKMCGWLASRISGIRTMPANPSDIKRMSELARVAEVKLRRLGSIASDLDWHADASLDFAWEQIQEYDREYHDTREEA